MPSISAPTVKEHHRIMFDKLVDAAEEILRKRGPEELTAGAVAKAAGIARNSIYRYVSSVDDLRILVLERYLPQWQKAVDNAIDRNAAPQQQILALAVVSLELAQSTGHSWLISVMKSARSARPANEQDIPEKHSEYHSDSVADFHIEFARRVTLLWTKVDPQTASLHSRINRALIDVGMKSLDAGESFEKVKRSVLAGISGLFTAVSNTDASTNPNAVPDEDASATS
ncbi:AcrR family transcriptional regulator [Arcanobacterium pluranimalium]|uniref:TetR/AcrR family transcriptional regulator n=1 Tax=Arcanobacterium pluranimalium TaxID=108028 RepID=UPI00195610DF|nr:TetR/AcrR family transcriptional regulator [Arcanobacterium pluranimalium]MBM7824492.1 AcrR family transcriptional regulator [Arcanobacterium pluranimalium]